jgi:hypothetical protein
MIQSGYAIEQYMHDSLRRVARALFMSEARMADTGAK